LVDLATRKSGLIADTSQGHHHRPRAQWHIQVVSKYALLDATFQQCHQVGVPAVIQLSKYLRDYRVSPGSDRQIAEHDELFGGTPQPQADIIELSEELQVLEHPFKYRPWSWGLIQLNFIILSS
jgi:hypothetical protein